MNFRRGIFGSLARNSDGETPFGYWSAPSATGMQINQQTALQVTTVMACVSILAEDVSKMTPVMFEEIEYLGYPNGKRRIITGKTNAVARVLERPNGWMTWPEFMQYLMVGLLLRGNGYAVIITDGAGQPNMLVPINPDRMRLWESPDGALFWWVSRAGLHEMAMLRSQPMLIPYENVLHIKGLSANGLIGMSKITVNREAVALALAQEQQYARLMANGARPAGLLTTEQKLTPEAAKRLRDDWEKMNSGLVNSGRTAVLEAGLKWESITLDSVDLQFLQNRGFQVQEICRMWRVPPHMVGDMKGATNNNIAQQSQEYRNNTLMTYSTLIEARLAMTFDLDEQGIKIMLDPDQLLRADITTRYNAHRIGILTGFEKPNEARITENRDVTPDGETLLQPTNMAPMGTLPSDAGGQGGQGSDQTGQGAPGAGKDSEDVTAGNEPMGQGT